MYTITLADIDKRKKRSGWFKSSQPSDWGLPSRFWNKTIKLSCGCWLWVGGIQKAGYGTFHYGNKKFLAHRFAYLVVRGEIDAGLQLDHLCRNKACVNPWHLEVVTQSVNVFRSDHHGRRKTHCPQGHEYTKKNTYLHTRSNGITTRTCRTCRAKSNIEYYRKYKKC